ncbi:YolD-like family protein [Paenibacillus filicis]|uniref:YolD-like family protein n=1 Tax=Paenibacillus gyeongsangnamensis TaxID=3388067 RepID=A0ABT4Q6J2_9BACL|nr:YolD-like family protein [Paenibacillus filicis]MCZ8512490.1 YolD-like family protein [Paenibacillus filicis]
MSDNKLTAGKNILWEGSRMMLPEHKEQLIQHRAGLHRTEKPLLDEQRLEDLAQAVSIALHEEIPVRLTVFDGGERITVEGFVVYADPQLMRIKIRCSEGLTWIPFTDLIGLELG